MRKAYSNYWPASTRQRKKQGFGAPVEAWLRQDKLVQLTKEYLENKNKKLFSLIDYNAAQTYIDSKNYKTWILLNLSMWLESRSLLLN